MDLRRLRTGEWLMAGAGLALFVSLFCTWYRVDATGAAHDHFSGWQATSIVDVVLALVAVAALGAAPVVARATTASPGVAYEALVFPAAVVAAVLSLVRLIDAPAAYLSPSWGVWVALVASLGLSAACLVAMRDERLSQGDALTDATGVPRGPSPAIETLPTPQP